MICPPEVRAILREMVLADPEDSDTGKSRTEHIIDMHWPKLLDAIREHPHLTRVLQPA